MPDDPKPLFDGLNPADPLGRPARPELNRGSTSGTSGSSAGELGGEVVGGCVEGCAGCGAEGCGGCSLAVVLLVYFAGSAVAKLMN